MISSDEILKGANRSPILTPILGGILNTILPESATKNSNNLIQSVMDNLKTINSEMKDSNNLLEQLRGLKGEGAITQSDFKEMQKLIIENQEQLKSKNSELKSKILELLDKN
jgi:hypothetical protein